VTRESAITIAALLLGAAALEKGLPAAKPAICPDAEIRYLPVPEIAPIRPAMSIALPPFDFTLWPSEVKDELLETIEETPEPRVRHHRRHWRHRRRW